MRATVLEWRRRGLIRAAAVYVAVAWGAVEILAGVLPQLNAPSWVVTLVVRLMVVGFPVAMFLAWFFDIGPDGIRRTEPDSTLGKATIATSLLLLVAGTVALNWLLPVSEEAAPASAQPALPIPEPAPRSLAVLDLRSLTGPEGTDYFSEGLADELAAALGKAPGVTLAARESARALQQADVEIREMGRRLGVKYVLSGSVRRAGGRARIDVSLVDCTTGYVAWRSQYERRVEDVLDLQSEVALAVVRELQLVLSPEEQALVRAPTTTDPQAWDLYQQARKQLRDAPAGGSLAAAERLLKASLALDPKFPTALAANCELHIELYLFNRVTDRLRQAEASCREALAKAPDLNDVNVALGRLYTHTGQTEQARVSFNHALERKPRLFSAVLGLAELDERDGRLKQAEAGYRRAIVLQPDFWGSYNRLGRLLFSQGRIEEAVAVWNKVVELSPANEVGLNNLGGAYLMLGRFEEAGAAYEEVLRQSPTSDAYSNVGSMRFFAGRFEDAESVYRQAVAANPNDARLWLNLGDACWFVPEGRARAKSAYRRAVALAREQLGVNPFEQQLFAIVAHASARLGDAQAAREASDTALSIGPPDFNTLYLLALAAGSLGDRSGAVTFLREALEQGYPHHLVAADPQFQALDLAVISPTGEL